MLKLVGPSGEHLDEYDLLAAAGGAGLVLVTGYPSSPINMVGQALSMSAQALSRGGEVMLDALTGDRTAVRADDAMYFGELNVGVGRQGRESLDEELDRIADLLAAGARAIACVHAWPVRPTGNERASLDARGLLLRLGVREMDPGPRKDRFVDLLLTRGASLVGVWRDDDQQGRPRDHGDGRPRYVAYQTTLTELLEREDTPNMPFDPGEGDSGEKPSG